jgi:hypothetical protein
VSTGLFEPSVENVYNPVPPFASAIDPHRRHQEPLGPALGRSLSPVLGHLLHDIAAPDEEDEELFSFCARYLKQSH